MSIYFILAESTKGDRYIKVGCSNRPWRRKNEVLKDSTLKPEGIDANGARWLVGWYPGDQSEERRVHDYLAKHRVVGEWFTDCTDVLTPLLNSREAVYPDAMDAVTLLRRIKSDPTAAHTFDKAFEYVLYVADKTIDLTERATA